MSKSTLPENNKQAKFSLNPLATNNAKAQPRGGAIDQASTYEPMCLQSTSTRDDSDQETCEGEIAVFCEGAEESKSFDPDLSHENDDTSTISMNSIPKQTRTVTNG